MLTAANLCEKLQITPKRLKAWLKAGLPSQQTAKGRPRSFDPAAVAQWLKSTGKVEADPEPPVKADAQQVATTRDEAAKLLGVHWRTLATWMKDPSFPGKAGSPGRQDGYFPIEEIQAWHAARFGSDGRAAAGGGASEDAELRREKLRLEVDQLRVEFERDQGRILDAQEVELLMLRHIATARTILEAISDKVESRLPTDLSVKLKAVIRKVVDETVREACESMAAAALDEDEEEEEPQE